MRRRRPSAPPVPLAGQTLSIVSTSLTVLALVAGLDRWRRCCYLGGLAAGPRAGPALRRVPRRSSPSGHRRRSVRIIAAGRACRPADDPAHRRRRRSSSRAPRPATCSPAPGTCATRSCPARSAPRPGLRPGQHVRRTVRRDARRGGRRHDRRRDGPGRDGLPIIGVRRAGDPLPQPRLPTGRAARAGQRGGSAAPARRRCPRAGRLRRRARPTRPSPPRGPAPRGRSRSGAARWAPSRSGHAAAGAVPRSAPGAAAAVMPARSGSSPPGHAGPRRRSSWVVADSGVHRCRSPVIARPTLDVMPFT